VDANADGLYICTYTSLLNATTWNLLAKNTCGTCHARDICFFLFRGGWGNIICKVQKFTRLQLLSGMRVSSCHPLTPTPTPHPAPLLGSRRLPAPTLPTRDVFADGSFTAHGYFRAGVPLPSYRYS